MGTLQSSQGGRIHGECLYTGTAVWLHFNCHGTPPWNPRISSFVEYLPSSEFHRMKLQQLKECQNATNVACRHSLGQTKRSGEGECEPRTCSSFSGMGEFSSVWLRCLCANPLVWNHTRIQGCDITLVSAILRKASWCQFYSKSDQSQRVTLCRMTGGNNNSTLSAGIVIPTKKAS